MSEQDVGSISWTDLTVPDADKISAFYSEVVGWNAEAVAMKDDMGEYDDFTMSAPEGVGICHARGPNRDLPPQWVVHITVEDADHSAKRCVELGGKILVEPKRVGKKRFCVIQDPAGAVTALYGPDRPG